MAVVRFSKELTEAILENANKKMEPAIERARKQAPPSEWGQRIYDTLFGELQPVLTKVPAGWLNHINEISIEQVGGIECSYKYTLLTKMPWPVEFSENELIKKKYTFRSDLILKKHPSWEEYYNEVKTHRDLIRAATARQNEFTEMVEKVIGTYATLAPALKAWPALWELIPEAYKDKHREIVERKTGSKREKEVPDVDFTKLTAMAAAAKIGV
jgi:hypothetical protein